MVNRDIFHSVHFTPLANQISCTNAAAINAAFPTALDTSDFEGNAIILYFADVNNVLDCTYTMFESDVSATDAGTACDHADVRVKRNDGTVTKCPETTGVLTTTAAADEDFLWIFEYLGTKRWIRVTAGVGSADVTPGMMGVQTDPRHGPAHE